MKFRLRGRAQVSVVSTCECTECGNQHDHCRISARQVDLEIEAEDKQDVLDFLVKHDEMDSEDNEEVIFQNWIEAPSIEPFRQEDFMRASGEPELLPVAPLTGAQILKSINQRNQRLAELARRRS